ncbi:molybdopterin synthase sulfur carrier subunit [Bowdeniella nasicola]|uniref:Molybdopterin synthase sulfur carrier subunit n=1 Tax=Bowdeniella nasicola TaxID=208480 RepID=A0A1Q5Q596_9ACTO|nr:MoaD/ThiS family protein [Bowdeniella nasicola]OKL55008.1 molybdopterin synthase sulfur carrier subunit [Bowdeniella nasicola]
MTDLRIRYFAGAAQAAGTHETTVAVADGQTLASLCDTLAAGNERLEKVLAVSSFVIDGVVTKDRNALVSKAATLDILPPFAGG